MQIKCYAYVKTQFCYFFTNQQFSVFKKLTERNSQYYISNSIFEKHNRYGTKHFKRQQSGKRKKTQVPQFQKKSRNSPEAGYLFRKKVCIRLRHRGTDRHQDLEDGGAKLTEILKNDVSIDSIYNAAKVGISMDNILDTLDLSEKIRRDSNDGKNKIDVMFSGNALKGRWCAKFVANRHKEFKVRELLYGSRHKGWLYIGNGIAMIASDLSADVIRRMFPQRQYKYHFVFDQSSKTDEGEFENNGK